MIRKLLANLCGLFRDIAVFFARRLTNLEWLRWAVIAYVGSPCRIFAGSFEIDVDPNVKAAKPGKGMKKRGVEQCSHYL